MTDLIEIPQCKKCNDFGTVYNGYESRQTVYVRSVAGNEMPIDVVILQYEVRCPTCNQLLSKFVTRVQ